ncbi:MAG: PEP-CTERM sorting domain-containing protein [Pirellula sp.]
MKQMKIVLSQWIGSVSLVMMAILTLVTPGLQTAAVAGLVTGGGNLNTDGTNARFFDPNTPTDVINRYGDNSLSSINFIQVGFRTNNVSAFDITNIAWSRDNVSYTAFTPSDSVTNIAAPPNFRYTSIISLSAPAGSPFYIRFTLPAGIDVGKIIESRFIGNSDGLTSSGVLASDVNNTFLALTRTHTAIPEPTSMLLVLSGAGWVVCRARRKRSKTAGIVA